MAEKKSWFIIILIFILFGAVNIFAGNIIVNEDGIQANYYSNDGNEGLTQNITYLGTDGENYSLIVQNGLIISSVQENSSGEENQSNFPNDNLVSYYKLDEGSGDVVDSADSNDGTNNGATREQEGKISNAYLFDGNNDYIVVPDDSSLDVVNQMTLSAWINPTNISGDNALISKWYDGSKRAYFFGLRDGKLRFALSNPTGTAADLDVDLIGPTLSINNWHHVALTFVAGGNAYVYVNGVQYGPWAKTGAISDNVDSLTFGSYRGTHYFFDGRLDEIGIWSRSLNSSEILELYNNGTGIAYN